MNSLSQSRPAWPLWVWCGQIPVVGFATVVSLWRLAKDAALPGSWLAWSVLLVSLLWLLGVVVTLMREGGRDWIARNRNQWLAVATSSAFAFALLDAGMTWLGIVPTIDAQRERSVEYTMGRFTSFRMSPKDVLMADGSTMHINRRGFRGEEIVPVKPEGRTRVVFLGGSQVLDYHGADWPAQSGALLRSRGYDVDVINAGVAGYNSVDSLASFLTDLWVLEPDIVHLCHAWNDIKYFARISPDAPYRGPPPAQPTWWTGDWRLNPTGFDRLFTLSAIYRIARMSIIELFVSEEGRYTWRDLGVPVTDSTTIKKWGVLQFAFNLELAAVLAEQIGAKLTVCKQAHVTSGMIGAGVDAQEYAARNLFLDPSEVERAFAEINNAIDNLAKRRGIPVADMRPLADNPGNFHDAIHFNETGSAAAATLMANALEAVLIDSAASDCGSC